VCLHLAHISMRLGWSCYASACACKHQGLWMYLHTMAGIRTHTELSVYLHLLACIEEMSMSLHF
jgi:hypothetical protein